MANIVVGTICNITDTYPEGMTRVILLGDPIRNMGALAEPECRRIIGAIDPTFASANGEEPEDWRALVSRLESVTIQLQEQQNSLTLGGAAENAPQDLWGQLQNMQTMLANISNDAHGNGCFGCCSGGAKKKPAMLKVESTPDYSHPGGSLDGGTTNAVIDRM